MQEKTRKLESLYHGGTLRPDMAEALKQEEYEYRDYAIMKEFRGTHPQIMSLRISHSERLRPRRNRWLNPKFYRAVIQKGFRG